jgi:predicted heme/steroid binding protein
VFLSLVFSISAKDKVDTLKGMTISELAKFDGKDGNKAYVAVDSIIYDVSNVKPWKGGEHNGHKAGTDLSNEIKKAPHGYKPIKKLPKVGKLIAIPDTTDKAQD